MEVIQKFAELVKADKIKLTDDAEGIRVDYSLNNDEMIEFLKLNNKDNVNDVDEEFKSTLSDIIEYASNAANEAAKQTSSSEGTTTPSGSETT
jgi:hypothetical protein